MAHKIEVAPTGRATCRGCKKTIAKGELRFGEEYQSPYAEDGGLAYRYWHLPCAATKLANELRETLPSYDGDIPERAELDALVESHARPVMPYAERAPNGRARCRGCDETLKKGELRVAFERVFEGPMGMQKAAGYVHPRCVALYLERERERAGEGGKGMELEAARDAVRANSKLGPEDLALVLGEMVPPAP